MTNATKKSFHTHDIRERSDHQREKMGSGHLTSEDSLQNSMEVISGLTEAIALLPFLILKLRYSFMNDAGGYHRI